MNRSAVTEPECYSYPRYLQAKRSVDARALNRRVWTRFLNALPRLSEPLRMLEVGGGVGATFSRVVEALEDTEIHTLQYTLVEREPDNVHAAREHVTTWASDRGYTVAATQSEEEIHLTDGPLDVHLTLVTADLFAFAGETSAARFDVVIAQAVLDLLSLHDFFSSLRPLLKEGGLWYLPIHFDGVTGFDPPIDPQLDDKIERLYHESMTDSNEEGGRRARTGRRLLTLLPEQGDEILAAGSSDWIVFPHIDGYPEEERYFLHHILHFIEDELSDHPQLERSKFQHWIRMRRQQVNAGSLVYVAHQLDVLAQI